MSASNRENTISPPDESDVTDSRSAPQATQRTEINPGSNDVILGRGKPYQNHSGNRRMLQIVADHKEDYNAKARDAKRAFVHTVLEVILEGGAKFLKRIKKDGEDCWQEVSKRVAAEKVWHALRCKGKSKKTTRAHNNESTHEAPPCLPNTTGTIRTLERLLEQARLPTTPHITNLLNLGAAGGGILPSQAFNVIPNPMMSMPLARWTDLQLSLPHALAGTVILTGQQGGAAFSGLPAALLRAYGTVPQNAYIPGLPSIPRNMTSGQPIPHANASTQLAPPQLAPPQLAPPQLAPPQLAPPQLAPPQLALPQLASPVTTRHAADYEMVIRQAQELHSLLQAAGLGSRHDASEMSELLRRFQR